MSLASGGETARRPGCGTLACGKGRASGRESQVLARRRCGVPSIGGVEEAGGRAMVDGGVRAGYGRQRPRLPQAVPVAAGSDGSAAAPSGKGPACRRPCPCRAMAATVCKEVGGRGAATQRIFRLPPSVGDDSRRVGRPGTHRRVAVHLPRHRTELSGHRCRRRLPPPAALRRPRAISNRQTSGLPQGDGIRYRSRPAPNTTCMGGCTASPTKKDSKK